LKKAILQANLSKTTQILMIYKGRHIFSPLSMPGTLLDCGGLHMTYLTVALTFSNLVKIISCTYILLGAPLFSGAVRRALAYFSSKMTT
jgi:hypothetical protein